MGISIMDISIMDISIFKPIFDEFAYKKRGRLFYKTKDDFLITVYFFEICHYAFLGVFRMGKGAFVISDNAKYAYDEMDNISKVNPLYLPKSCFMKYHGST